MVKKERIYHIYAALLLCFLQTMGGGLFAQGRVITADSLIINADSLINENIAADSIAVINKENMEKLSGDTVSIMQMENANAPLPDKKVWTPNPTKATWLAVVFPGGGQIYNRKYWKLPIIYGGFAGCAYALNWNNNMYKDYSQAYLDIMDKDPTTNSYLDLLRPGVVIDENTDTRYSASLKKQKDYYRRYRDISVFAFIGVYLLSIIDAYVDAELSNFDITPDISMRVEPAVINNSYKNKKVNSDSAIGLQCNICF